MQNLPIQTIEVPIGELIPADYNPRKHDEVATEQLKQSILKFGLVEPIIARHHQITGQQRALAS